MNRKLIKLARSVCANRSLQGPYGLKDYCCLEPEETECQCVLLHDLACGWFERAVLPNQPELDREWRAFKESQHRRTKSQKKCVACGAGFIPKSNRQKYCPDCGKNNRKNLSPKSSKQGRPKTG